MGSLIQVAVKDGHPVLLLWDRSERKPGEAVVEDDFRPWRHAVRIVSHERGTPLVPVLTAHAVDVVIGPTLYLWIRTAHMEADVAAARRAGIRFCSIDYAFETVNLAAESYRIVDITFYMSDFQRELHWRLMRDDFDALQADLATRSAVCGSSMLDQLAEVDRQAVRRRYGLPATTPLVLLMSLKMAVPDPWRRFVWGGGPAWWRALGARVSGHGEFVPEILSGNGYAALMSSLKRFCGRTGAVLVVKSREKNRDPRFVRRAADLFVPHDADVFPYTSMQLMAIADLCIHFQSGAVFEAAFTGVPSVSIKVAQSHIAATPGFESFYGGAVGSPQNFPGVVWPVEHDGVTTFFESKSLGDFVIDASARRDYVEKFLGFDDTVSSRRILDVIRRESREVAPR